MARSPRRLASLVAAYALVSLALFAPPALAGLVSSAIPVTPTKMTNFSPPRNNSWYAGHWLTIASNPTNGRNLFGYIGSASSGVRSYYGVQVTDSTGPVGAETVLVSEASDCAYANAFQMASAYNPVSGGWVVAYKERCGDFLWKAQFLNADGSVDGGPITLSSPITDPDNGIQIDVEWNPNAKHFFFVWHNYSSSSNSLPNFIGRVVEPDGTVTGSEIDLMPSLTDYDDYGPMSFAYSTKSDRYLLAAYIDGEMEIQLLDGDGQPIGDYVPLPDAEFAPSVAYNAVRDEFAVATEIQAPSQYQVNIQRVKAADGALIGGWEFPVPEGFLAGGYRPRIVAPACADEYYVTAYGTDNANAGQYGYRVAGDLSAPLGSLYFLSAGLGANLNVRTNATYNEKTNQYWSGWSADPTGVTGYDIYAAPVTAGTQLASCASAKSKPKLKKRGTAGATSLRVRVGCADGAGPCRVRLSGKLRGGSGRLIGQTVRLGSNLRTVKLRYTSRLISQLARKGGGKIRVTAREVGGGTRTIVVTVPSSVTG